LGEVIPDLFYITLSTDRLKRPLMLHVSFLQVH